MKETKQRWKELILALEAEKEKMEEPIIALKTKRRQMSAALQKGLFESYSFLNAKGQRKDLLELFSSEGGITPPSGAGECAAPKLLQFAYQHKLKPLALAEFWWGPSPPSEIRKHSYFYPSCRSKCLPILGHMLEGIPLGADSTKENPAEGKDLPIVFEDDHIIVVNKPAEFLSVPGKNITDSVYTRIAAKCPDATGPMIVHRLDMSTSGLMLLAKSKEVHRHLQSQFLKRRIKKTYVAVLDGEPNPGRREINLPLRVDLDHRPRQVVCYKYGKPSITHWEKVSVHNGCTRVHFYPITGRTHQLRVHAAHTLGLNTPILGDDLYGKRAERLYLHAASITFQHPISGNLITLEVAPEF
jgi:tRNA pseudouridine32 synthase/23S rRNA pseudouridine746 synthase